LAATVRADTAAAVADPLGRSSAPMSDGQIATVCGTLDRHDVEYVVVGGAAAQLHGAPTARTRDVDVVPGRSADNLQRLAQALDEMNARMWVGEHEPDGIPTPFGATFQGPFDTFLNLITDHGPLDINLYIDGTDGRWRYEDLAVRAGSIDVLGTSVRVAALEDVIDSKEAAGREKDLAVLPTLLRFLRERRR
jgi:predicted nucleotidyltransferase